MNAVLFPNFKKKNALRCALDACDILHALEIHIAADESCRLELGGKEYVEFGEISALIAKSDIVISIGGDGTILKCAKLVAGTNRPILGINSGRLGFMASVEPDELASLSRLKTGDYAVEKRMMLNIAHLSGGVETHYTALNDVIVASHFSRLTDFKVLANQKTVSEIRADGLVFSTPTGSTAYSLSAGGPILEPDMECIEFTPICPHSLFSRPILFSDKKVLEVHLDSPDNPDVYFTVDGTQGIQFHPQDRLLISKSEHSINLIDIKKSTFFDSVNQKLMRSIKGDEFEG